MASTTMLTPMPVCPPLGNHDYGTAVARCTARCSRARPAAGRPPADTGGLSITKPIDGTTYVVTGGGGRCTRPVGESGFTAFSASVAHFLFVDVEGPDMRVYAVDGTGQVFDFAHIEQKHT